jgi:hypothetical protein
MNKLTDLEICKRIAEIEGIDYSFHKAVNALAYTAEFDEVLWYNPLTDDALCFQLMVKYDMPPMKSGAPNLYECVFDMDRALSGAGIICDESPNKAICLAIIEARKDIN